MTTLYQKLQKANSEEDVKDIYIKALGLKNYQKGLVDLQTKEIWFEAKIGGSKSTYEMFSQLLYYVNHNLKIGEDLPPFLCVIDSRKAAIMKTSDAIPLLEKKTIEREKSKSASKLLPGVVDAVSAYIGTYIVSFNIETHEEEFVSTVKNAISKGDIIRTQITPDNLKQVFDKRIDLIGKEILDVHPEDYSLLFFADIMHDGTISTHANLPAELLHRGASPVFTLGGKMYELSSKEGYREFWAIYAKPPKEEYRDYLLERRDSLIPVDERSFKGAYYTPLHVVDKAYDKLTSTLGKNRQKNYIIRDMCCGVGNLEVKHSNPRNIYMSTLDQADVDVMKATKTCVGAQRFQYDYLNDDITENGAIDYNLTNKVPQGLRDAIASGKKLLILINPPYGEAGNTSTISSAGEHKKDIGANKITIGMDQYGYGKRELFVQFIHRIQKEIPSATLAMFSTLKYINAPNFEKFREIRSAKYLDGFIVHSKAFDGLKGEFPIGFLIRKTKNDNSVKYKIEEVTADVLDKYGNPIGEKTFYNLPKITFLNKRFKRPRSNNHDALPLKNALTPATVTKDLRGSKRADGAIGSMLCNSNMIQNASTLTALLSSGFGSAGAFFITPENLEKAAIVFSVRRLIKPTRINDRDQFLQPTGELSEEFMNDCLIYMLFSGSNLTASADDLERNDKKRSIVNHFIPYTETEVNSPERFESDFMVQYISDKKFSPEAKAVLQEGKNLWKAYFSKTDSHAVREEYKLNRADVGRYQIRNALKKRNQSVGFPSTSFENFEEAYKTLTHKLRPQVYEYGFLKV